MSGGEAGAQFYSPHASVRDAIESALPKLREMMAEAGVTLGQAQVRDEALPRQTAFSNGEEEAQPNDEEGVSGVSQLERGGLVPARARMGMVDLYI
jgi:flagellar hook-length control protein FliK